MKKYLITSILIFTCFLLSSQEKTSYQIPKKELLELIDVELAPSIIKDSKNENFVFLYRDAYKSISDLSQEELRIAGLRVNPSKYIGSRTTYYKNVKVLKLSKSKEPLQLKGLPSNPKLSNFKISPDESKIALTNTTNEGVEVWVADLKTLIAKRIYSSNINATLGDPITWLKNNNELLIKTIPDNKKALIDRNSIVPTGPTITENEGQKAQNRTYQDLIKNPDDAFNFTQLSLSNIVKIDLKGKEKKFLDSKMYRSVSVSPNGSLVMVSFIKTPFSYLVPYYRFPTEYRVYSDNGDLVKVIQDTPLTEELPKGRMSTTTEPRNIGWRDDLGASLYFFKALDKGDPENKIEFRDALFQWDYPFNNEPQLILKVNNRLSNVVWGNNDIAIATDIWWNNRNVKTYLFNPSNTSKKALVIENRNYQDIYSDPGNFLMKKSKYNTKVLNINNNTAFLLGSGFTENGQFPFIDKINLEKNSKERLYQSSFTKKYENIIDYDPEKEVAFVRIESPKEFPNYYFRDVISNKLNRITFFKNPFKALEKVKKEIITYKRDDGLDLSGVLYLPEDASVGEKKPMILWAYPREYKDKSTASQKRSNPNTFTYPSMRNPIYWATQGYVVLDRAEFPIVGEGDSEPNDSFRKQLVANGKAAIDAVDKMGFIDRDRVGVGGHSYGAFMVANLLSHSNLFAAGIARSGAYNRTLTPFGFQSEERSYWEAPDVYYSMSPFMHANKMKTPLLLVHGEEDNNSGTYPLQSVRYFNALKGLGATTRLVMFPKESHGYRAKESILHLIWEQDRWLDMHVKNKKKKFNKEKNKPKG